MTKKIVINPVTRLEGHGKIDIFVSDKGEVLNAVFQPTELRMFEKFCEGRCAEEMPRITSRICGVCPTAHHMASTKCLDDLFKAEPPKAARLIRELLYHTFMVEDHLLHFYILAAPDFLAPTNKVERNVVGLLKAVGKETVGKVVSIRGKCRELMERICGNALPVCGLPGGVSKPLTDKDVEFAKEIAQECIGFSKCTLQLFKEKILQEYKELILKDELRINTYYMGLVSNGNALEFYDGNLRIVDPDGEEYAKFHPKNYLNYIEEHVEAWSYVKMPYLKGIGWKGITDGKDSGVYRVAPLARCNVADKITTKDAHEEFKEMYETIGEKPVHHTLAFHWARLIEVLYSTERMQEIANNPFILSERVRNENLKTPDEGIGCVEAPRGTLIHHYKTDEDGILKEVNLIVGSQHNLAAINLSVKNAAKIFINTPEPDEEIMNMVEMVFRAYDPCLACASHAISAKDIVVNIKRVDDLTIL
jgi:F420-non-reducing hydrogenase large subunit